MMSSDQNAVNRIAFNVLYIFLCNTTEHRCMIAYSTDCSLDVSIAELDI